jgi:FtsP/CotA-like multicopper oxidase with cupredoxin domain
MENLKKFLFQKLTLFLTAVFMISSIVFLSSCKENSVESPVNVMSYDAWTINGKAYPDTEPLRVRKGDTVRVRFMNISNGVHPMHLHGHDFKVVAVDGWPVAIPQMRNTVSIAPGEILDIEFVADNPGLWAFHCHELHHAEQGMFTFVLYEGFSLPKASDAFQILKDIVGQTTHASIKLFKINSVHADSVPWTGQIKEYTLTASPIQWTIKSGTVTPAYAFNGKVPGPEIRLNIGDSARVNIINNLSESTSIHWHGINRIAWTDDGVAPITQTAIPPGGTKVYRFFVDRAGSFMYHPHFMSNEASQIDKGMYGPIIVEPQQKTYTKEYTMMLGGWIVKQPTSGSGH